MSKPAKKIYKALAWFFSAVIACGCLSGCGPAKEYGPPVGKYGPPASKYGPPPSQYVAPAKTENNDSTSK